MDFLQAIDALDDLVFEAPSVPLTDRVRLKREDLDAAVARFRELPSSEPVHGAVIRHLIEQLERLAAAAEPLPVFRSQVQVDKGEIYELLDRMRVAYAEEKQA